VFVIAEGLMMYLAADARRHVFRKVRQLAATTGEVRFIFDLTPGAKSPQGALPDGCLIGR
jgi:O-methyltransferase involved in polyketide biosynthesis